MDNNFNMTFEESQDYISRRGFDIPWNDCDVFVDERDITRTIGNVLKWADKTMIEKACEWLIRGGYFVNSNETIEDFRKAMEE